MPPSRKTERIAVDNYRYYFSIPVAGEVNEVVEKHTSPLQGTYELLQTYCKVTMVTGMRDKPKDKAMIQKETEIETDEVTLDTEQWATWHPAHVNILIRWMNEHIFGLKGVEARLLEARSSSTNTKS